MSYDRAARRVADNAHGNTPTGDYTEVHDIVRATYPDPKVAHLKVAKGGNSILAEKYELAARDNGLTIIEDAQITHLTATKVTKAKAKA